MLLSNKTIRNEISADRIFKLNCGHKALSDADFIVKSSSVDLTIGKIYEPSNDKVRNQQQLQDLATYDTKLKPGDTLLIEVNEKFNLSNNIGGIVFPPNSLSKEGVIMTNPGHIDPGYKGLITVCLVNMGKDDVRLKAGDVIARLLLVRLDGTSDAYKGAEVTSVTSSHLDKLAKDFAGISNRLPGLINTVFVRNLAISLALVALMFSALTLFLPELSKSRIEMLTHSSITNNLIEPVKKDYVSKVEALSDSLTKEIELMKKELQVLKEQNNQLKNELELRVKKEVSPTND
ncbi:hypothetical protein [Alishewanella sp. SMS8]|uniref:dCTP deaminase domain-containing protein n=1 Tax=Alishewanella sp. SMS8 TaxID=2994676 RepID=UPI0027412A64|nr:hypothetical protein [Alishewanella sp. SMS8]MDP5460065.1 hypothetical protein [Alishewanella sp. SMS8]